MRITNSLSNAARKEVRADINSLFRSVRIDLLERKIFEAFGVAARVIIVTTGDAHCSGDATAWCFYTVLRSRAVDQSVGKVRTAHHECLSSALRAYVLGHTYLLNPIGEGCQAEKTTKIDWAVNNIGTSL